MNATAAIRARHDDRAIFRDPPPDPAAPDLAVTHLRLMVLMLLFMIVTALIAGRMAQLWLFADRGGGGGAAAAVPRGDIVDRNGMPLATSIQAWAIAVNPQAILGDRDAIARRLAELMPERSVAQYRAILWSKKRKFLYLRNPALPSLVAQVHAIGEPALMEMRETQRLYPQATLAGHALGYAQIVDNPRTHKPELTGIGIERYFDADLRRGRNVALSLDGRVQAALEGEIARRISEVSAVGGAGVVMDIRTGEVLALASLPSINPNAPLRVLADIPNKATQSTYELGSTFKMLTFADAIERGVLTDMAKTYDVSAPIRIGGHTIHDDEPMHRALTVPEVMTYSSNIGTAKIAEEIGPERIQAFFRTLGFYDTTGIELRERGHPQVPHYWARTTVMTTAFGHGIAVTPLHLAEAYAALANGGILRRATLLKHDPATPVAGKRVISEATSARIRQLMRLVVLQGTGTNANAPGLRVGGKTGTAEKVVAGGYAKNANVTVFAGAFPMDAPRYVVLVMLDDAKASKGTYGFKTAGWMAAPLAKRVVARIGPLLGIRPDTSHDIDVSDLMALLAEKKDPGKNVVE